MPDAFASSYLRWAGELATVQSFWTLTQMATILGQHDRPLIHMNCARAISMVAQSIVAETRMHEDVSPELLHAVLGALNSASKDDRELIYSLRMALRDCLLVPGSYQTVEAIAQNDPPASEAVADVSLGASTSESAAYLLGHLQRTKLATPRAGEYLKHVALYLPAERIGEVADLTTKINDAPLLQRLVAADGLGPNGSAATRQSNCRRRPTHGCNA